MKKPAYVIAREVIGSQWQHTVRLGAALVGYAPTPAGAAAIRDSHAAMRADETLDAYFARAFA